MHIFDIITPGNERFSVEADYFTWKDGGVVFFKNAGEEAEMVCATKAYRVARRDVLVPPEVDKG